ncbi:hypothetical protein Pan44_03910 [Caulifigura coniformis]|uniref:Uncharacterized protein n=1 Tax=Caulifigura coniformis TaxID=2527983 RepID=A0A517S8D3_9PLAN|nr:hypothetical protein [Caulifigura coniformis]QDT52381.1 hypothetical protein Pan44_03910 [Caulifigura coniformis]
MKPSIAVMAMNTITAAAHSWARVDPSGGRAMNRVLARPMASMIRPIWATSAARNTNPTFPTILSLA